MNNWNNWNSSIEIKIDKKGYVLIKHTGDNRWYCVWVKKDKDKKRFNIYENPCHDSSL